MHSRALQASRSCCAAPQSSTPPRKKIATAASSSSIAPSTTTTTTTKQTPPSFGVADSARALSDPHVLIVHEKRSPQAAVAPESVRELMRADSVKAIVSVSSPEQAADALASAVSAKNPQLAAAVRSDVLSATAALSSALPLAESFSAKLEVVTRQSCPKWHSDYVNCRCLVTYAGKGTLVAPPEAVLSAEEARRRRRRRGKQQQAAATAACTTGGEEEGDGPALGGGGGGEGGGIPVDESLVVQAEPFDFLFLKGRASAAAVGGAEAARAPPPLWQRLLDGGGSRREAGASPHRSLLAIGAVHKSPPEASEECPRLVLTIDDACECCGG